MVTPQQFQLISHRAKEEYLALCYETGDPKLFEGKQAVCSEPTLEEDKHSCPPSVR